MSVPDDRKQSELAGQVSGITPYRVLARKYRPATFADLIGQEAMVRTVSNAFETDRIPQAWILTGVRGVGKTTTARILARALNYELPDGSVKRPTVNMPILGIHCQAIMDSRHIDVLEMDAASHNGVEDVRQINDAIRYAPVSARYKVYILDEVHMLSSQAFNALLKTLEEPPPHAKFIFATTEIRKVPITVLSRCQRFDLRRVDTGELMRHLESIARSEQVEVEAAALALIARAAEGSVRDSLSLLDQAIAHAAGPVRAEDVRQMLGLADRARIIDLFESLMRGDIASALAELRSQYETGADAAVVLGDLAEFTHFVTRVKIVPAVADDPTLIETERSRGRALAERLSMRVLSRTWQMLLKGIAEVNAAGRPLAAAEMILVRIAYATDLPAPEEIVRSLSGKDPQQSGASPEGGGWPSEARPGGGHAERNRAQAGLAMQGARTFVRGESSPAELRAKSAAPAGAAPAPAADSEPKVEPLVCRRLEDLIALAAARRDLGVKLALERDVRLVRCEDGRLEVALESSAAKSLVNELARKFSQWTNRPWSVVASAEEGEPTIRAQMDARKVELKSGVRADPLVQAVLARFPGAEIVDVRKGDTVGLGHSETAFSRPPPPVDADDIEPEPEEESSAFGTRSAKIAGYDDL